MEEKKKKCPLCNKKLVMRDGVPTCPDCGYRDPYRSSGSRTQGTDGGYGQPSNSYSQPGSGYQQPNGSYQQSNGGYRQPDDSQSVPPGGSYRRPNGGQSRQNPIPQPKRKNPRTVVIVAMIAMTAVSTIVSLLVGLFSTLTRGEWSSHWETGADASSSVEGHQDPSGAPAAQGSVGSVSHLTFNQPEGELLKEFVEQLFGRPASSVTREELNSVTGLEICGMGNATGTKIAYVLSDGTAGTCYLSSTRLDSKDFKCFPRIQTLDLGKEALDWQTDWHDLTSLTSLTCQVSLDDLEKYMDVSQLTSLSFRPDFFMSDFEELEAYSNLECLRVDCNHFVRSLTGLSRAELLKTFILEDAGSITDYRELYDMKQLRELSIESMGLQDIGFISDMAALESLELIDADMPRIDAIADRADTLKCLRLHLNRSVEDYGPVLACTGLEELELYISYSYAGRGTTPDFSVMPGLRTLTLGNFDTFPGLEGLTALESLTFTGGMLYGEDEAMAGLGQLNGLKTFALLDTSIKPDALEVLSGMGSLETLDLTGTFVWGDLNTVFGMPGLKTLILDDVDFGLMLDGMPVSESLLELDLTDANVHYLLEDGTFDLRADSTRIRLGDNTEFFDHMPNLTTLTVPGHDLRDVEFAGHMAQLTYLDIRSNEVTDLSPLTGLEQLKVLNCKNNPVHDLTGLENVIVID